MAAAPERLPTHNAAADRGDACNGGDAAVSISIASSTASPRRGEEWAPLLPTQSSEPGKSSSRSSHGDGSHGTLSVLLPVVYGLTNLGSVVAIVVVNKWVLYTYKFKFAATLTWMHTIFTAVGMAAMGMAGVFPVKKVPVLRTAPIAGAYVASIVLNNLSLQLNTVGFYQITKILITPAVMSIEYVLYHKTVTQKVACSTVVMMIGVAMASVADKAVSAQLLGAMVAMLNVFVTGLYQVWAGAKQKELEVNAMQLLHQMAPVAVVLLGFLIPFLEPIGFTQGGPDTVLGFLYTPALVKVIVLSCVLGLVVTLSTFLFIGATSSLTYNVVGNLKTVGIIAAGMVFFGDTMTLMKLGGLTLAMTGIAWYTQLKMQPQAAKPAA